MQDYQIPNTVNNQPSIIEAVAKVTKYKSQRWQDCLRAVKRITEYKQIYQLTDLIY